MAVQDYLESMDFLTLRDLILSMAPSNVDTSEGSFLYDAVTPIALFTSEVFNQMQLILSESFIGTATGSNLDNIAATMPRIYRRQATRERLMLHLEPYTPQIFSTLQDRISTMKFSNSDGELYSVNLDMESPLRNMTTYINVFVIKDVYGNGTAVKTDPFEPRPTVDGLTQCICEEVVANGDEEETDDEFRVRVWATMASPFLGSVADYQRKIFAEFPSSTNGFVVSNCMIIPRGSRSGYICVIPSKLSVDNETIHCTAGELESLQNYLDERVDGIGGYGISVAPIGHVIKVRDFTDFNLDFHVTVVVAMGEDTSISPESQIRIATIAYLQSIINEVIPSVTNFSQTARRFVVYLIYYYLNSHESAVLTALRNRFGTSVIRNVVIMRAVDLATPEVTQFHCGEFIFSASSTDYLAYVKEDGTRMIPYIDFGAEYAYVGEVPSGVTIEFENFGGYLGMKYSNENEEPVYVSDLVVSQTISKRKEEQKDLVLRSGDSKGVLPVLRNLYVDIVAEGSV